MITKPLFKYSALACGIALTSPVWACSICRCGDPTYNALGHEGVAQTGLRMAFDWDEVKKTQGVRGDESETMRERRSTLLLAYGVSDRIGVKAAWGENNILKDCVQPRHHTAIQLTRMCLIRRWSI